MCRNNSAVGKGLVKKINVSSLVIISMLFFSLAGCQKAEQQTAVEGFKVARGTFQKGGLGFILSSANGEVAVAMKKLDTPFKNIMKVKGQIKTALLSGTRNGFITFTGQFVDNSVQGARAGILIGGKKSVIAGDFVEKVEKPQDFDQGKVFTFELIIDLKEKTVTFNVDGQNIGSKMTEVPSSITQIGFVNSGTKTEFSDLQISGD